MAWNVQFGGSRGQRSKSQEAEVRFRGLAEASFSTPLGRVGFLVLHSLLLIFCHSFIFYTAYFAFMCCLTARCSEIKFIYGMNLQSDWTQARLLMFDDWFGCWRIGI